MELVEGELIDFVHRDSGQKIISPCFDAFTGRCFLRGRSSGDQAAGENTVRNGIMEIDPVTGAYDADDVFNAGGGSFTDRWEIDVNGNAYIVPGSEDRVRKYDLDFNLLESYVASAEFNSQLFGVNSRGDVVFADNSPIQIEYWSADKSTYIQFQTTDFEFTGSQLREVRLVQDRVYAIDSDNLLVAFDINSETVEWKKSVFGYRTMSIDFVGNIVIGGESAGSGRVRKLDPADGSTIWDVGVSNSSGTAPDITQIGVLSNMYYYAFAGVLGQLYILKTDGTVLDNVISGGRGNLGIHPFNNEYIQNFDLS